MLGIDIIPAKPPKGVSTIQGNFLSQSVQWEVKKVLRGSHAEASRLRAFSAQEKGTTAYLELEKQLGVLAADEAKDDIKEDDDQIVDVVLSDMSAPWEQTEGFWKRSLSDPYYRMMNTSGISFKDHTGSTVWLDIIFWSNQALTNSYSRICVMQRSLSPPIH